MGIEHEVRVLEVDSERLEEKLVKLGAVKEGDYNYKRRVYDFNPVSENKWIRLRTNGNKTTLTIKEIKSREIDGTEEYEIEVSDFDDTNIILNKLGYKSRSYQENKRTRYKLDNVEIDIDTWPNIPTYAEIEGQTIEDVNMMIEKLELNKEKVTTLDVQSVFEEIYNINLKEMSELKFDNKLEEKYYIKK